MSETDLYALASYGGETAAFVVAETAQLSPGNNSDLRHGFEETPTVAYFLDWGSPKTLHDRRSLFHISCQ